MNVSGPRDCFADPIASAMALAGGFSSGALLAVRAPGRPDHAHHLAVEFVHPVVAGARSLPSIAVSEFASPPASDTITLLIEAPHHIADAEQQHDPDLVIPGHLDEAIIVRTYHLLWELVHIVLEHPGLTDGRGLTGGDSTGFLYPFLDASETDDGSLTASLQASVTVKCAESESVAARALAASAADVQRLCELITATSCAGRRVLLAGNGGSACDAARFERLLLANGIDAMSLSSNPAVLSALANDLGAGQMFARQVEAVGRPGDLLICLTTSGASTNLVAAAETASGRGLTTAVISGYNGGSMVDTVDVCVGIDSQSVHRIQEAQAVMVDDIIRHLAAARRAA